MLPHQLKEQFLRPGVLIFYIYHTSLKHTEMGVWQQVQEYLYLKKRDPNSPDSSWMKYMHGINRISIFMFLLAMIVMVLKLTVFKRHH